MRFHKLVFCAVILITATGGPAVAEEAMAESVLQEERIAAKTVLEAPMRDPNESLQLALDPNEPPQLASDPNDPAAGLAGGASPDAEEAAVAALATAEAKSGGKPATPAEPGKKKPMDMAAVIALVQQQQAQLAKQEEMLADQSRQLDGLRKELDALRAPPVTEEPPQQIGKVEQDSQPIDMKVHEEQVAEVEEKTDEDKKTETSQAVATAQADDPTELELTDFPGAWRLPGTRAALAFGGYVKSALVYNWDPLEINDRFIVGSIPVDSIISENKEAESSLTASQSRINFDLREPTEVGVLRAFVEGDFAEENDTFRLRHAFGQWARMLAGKTWSAFVDTQATPEEVDFEGLNGRINVRQSQVRVSPRIGETFQFQFSLEDPNPQVQNGDGVTRTPDLVMSGRFQPNERLHTKVAVLGRQIRAQRDAADGGGLEKQYAWGLTVSGRYTTPKIGERDSLLFQVNAGDGIGRYVNDLASVGNFDGVFNTATGDLKLFDILAGYVSFQHWWAGTIRSNFTLGFVEVDNPGFVSGDAYKQTIRASGNLMWTPNPRIDLGVEFLWGERENEDGSNGDAKQIQAAARYRF
jgi:hypothetical protein